jgi:hypothetical protein
MKTPQIRAEEGGNVPWDACESRPAGGNPQTTTNIDGVLRQIICKELAAGDEQ